MSLISILFSILVFKRKPTKPMYSSHLYKYSKNTITLFKISANSKVVDKHGREKFFEIFSGIPSLHLLTSYVSKGEMESKVPLCLTVFLKRAISNNILVIVKWEQI